MKRGIPTKLDFGIEPLGTPRGDDFDVLADGVVVGRIFKANAAPVRKPLDVDVSIRAP
jgi:hypothetical protein